MLLEDLEAKPDLASVAVVAVTAVVVVAVVLDGYCFLCLTY